MPDPERILEGTFYLVTGKRRSGRHYALYNKSERDLAEGDFDELEALAFLREIKGSIQILKAKR